MRFGTGGDCDGPNANGANIRSIFRYKSAQIANPNSTAETTLPKGCYDETNLVPYVKTMVPQNVPKELKVQFNNTAGSGNMVQWQVNGMPIVADINRPTLKSVADRNTTFSSRNHVFTVGEKDKVCFLFSLCISWS